MFDVWQMDVESSMLHWRFWDNTASQWWITEKVWFTWLYWLNILNKFLGTCWCPMMPVKQYQRIISSCFIHTHECESYCPRSRIRNRHRWPFKIFSISKGKEVLAVLNTSDRVWTLYKCILYTPCFYLFNFTRATVFIFRLGPSCICI